MAGVELPQLGIGAPPPLVIDRTKRPPPFVDDSAAFRAGSALRTGVGTAAGNAADLVSAPPAPLIGAAVNAAKPAIADFGKGLFGMTDAPVMNPPATPIAAPPKPVAAPAAAPAPVIERGTVGGAAPAPVAAPAPAAAPASPEVYPVNQPGGVSQYLPQLMAAAASREAPALTTTAPPSPFTDRFGTAPITGTWEDLLNNKYQRSVQATANKTKLDEYNAVTNRRNADAGVFGALSEPIKADAANASHLASTAMTANTSRATTAATNEARMKEVETTGEYGLKRAEALAGARKYAADRVAQGKGSAVQKSITPDGKIVLNQLNSKGEVATRVVDPQSALAHQQADNAVMSAQHGEEVTIPGGKGVVRIVNGVRKVYDKKTGKDIGWTPPPAFSSVGMPPAGGGSNALEDFLDQ